MEMQNNTLKIELHSFNAEGNCLANVVIPGVEEPVCDFKVMKGPGGGVMVHMPASMGTTWAHPQIEWAEVRRQVTAAFRSRGQQPCETVPDPISVSLRDFDERMGCFADIVILKTDTAVAGLRVVKGLGDGVIVHMPPWMHTKWSYTDVQWSTVRRIVTACYKMAINGMGKPAEAENVKVSEAAAPAAESVQETAQAEAVLEKTPEMQVCQENAPAAEPEAEHAAAEKPDKEKTEMGRILNAENSPFAFYPRTVLRKVDCARKSMIELVGAINKGSIGGIGPFEINILIWVEKLRYVTKTMLLDLISSGYVSTGWRSGVTANKMTVILNRMQSYDLISLSRFVTVDDNGEPDDSGQSIARIITLGKTGNTLLHELGKNTRNYNPFDILQDGNTVKRYLTSNQWLIYWLTHYKEQMHDNYDTAHVVHQKGSEYDGARFYATVTLNDVTMIAEPARQVEEFEKADSMNWLRAKFERMTSMFDNLDQLYFGKDEIDYPQRPIIVYICENDAHIMDVWHAIEESSKANPDQKVWFTTDLRVFNRNMVGQRFLEIVDGEMKAVDTAAYFGNENESARE